MIFCFYQVLALSLFSHFSFGLLETQPTSPRRNQVEPPTLWLEAKEDELPKLFINKEEIKKKSLPVLSVKASEIYAGQLLAISDDDLVDQGPSHSTPLDENLSDKIFYVVRGGSEERPFFQLVGGHNRVRRALLDNPEVTINVQVIKDVTGFSHLEQGEILSMLGHFWSPENPNGEYRKLLILDTQTSPWRTLAKIKWIRNVFERYWDKNLAFTEIEFGKRIYLHLIENEFPMEKLATTKQVIKALQSLEPFGQCESALAK